MTANNMRMLFKAAKSCTLAQLSFSWQGKAENKHAVSIRRKTAEAPCGGKRQTVWPPSAPRPGTNECITQYGCMATNRARNTQIRDATCRICLPT